MTIDRLSCTLSALLSAHPFPFIYITDTFTPRFTSNILQSLLSDLNVGSPRIKYAHASVNAVACFTPRIFFDTTLNQLASWCPKWEDGCANWSCAEGSRWNENMDAFLHGLKAVHCELTSQEVELTKKAKTKGRGKGKGKEKEIDGEIFQEVRMLLVVEKAERLKDTLPELIVPLTRLAELTQIPLTIIFTSHLPWSDIRPPLGAAPDPFYVSVPPATKEVMLQMLSSTFPPPPSLSYKSISTNKSFIIHSAATRILHAQFLSTLHSVCAPFTTDPDELAYIAAARWPGYSHAVFTEFEAAYNADEDEDASNVLIDSVPEEMRIRLLRQFTPTFTAALEALYPRLTNAVDWAAENQSPQLPRPPVPGPSTQIFNRDPPTPSRNTAAVSISALPRVQKFILLASFLASTNPPKSDTRMFYRGGEERKKRRRRSGNGSPKKGGGVAKIPQRLLGPTPFPLDRLIAILGSLMEEHDPAVDASESYTDTETEVGRVGVVGSITDLTVMRLLYRTSSPEKLDSPPTFKCGISYDVALALAREVDVPLNDLMWEPM